VTAQTTATGRERMIATDARSRWPVRVATSCGSAAIDGSTISNAITQSTPPAASAPIATRQPSHWPRAVPSGTPSTIASELPRKTNAVAWPLRPGGASRAATGAMVDQKIPWTRAQISRASMSTRKVGASAAASWDTAKAATVPAISRCRGMPMVIAVSGIVVSPATTA
jgi:hypothetical protein